MEPTFYSGDKVLVNKLRHTANRISVGEVIVFYRPLDYDAGLTGKNKNHILIKRCVAVPGDTVSVSEDIGQSCLYVPCNGDTLTVDSLSLNQYAGSIFFETGIKPQIVDGSVYVGDDIVKEYVFKGNWYYVWGDNIDHSVDSRHFGLVPEEFIIGVVIGRKYRKRVVPADCL